MRCAAITNSFLQQEYPTYTILGQSQYQTCYPSSGFGVVPPADSSTESLALATTTYPEEKPNALVPARAVQRPPSGEAGSVKPLLAWAGAAVGKHLRGYLSILGPLGHCLPCHTALTALQSIRVGQPNFCTRNLLLLPFQDCAPGRGSTLNTSCRTEMQEVVLYSFPRKGVLISITTGSITSSCQSWPCSLAKAVSPGPASLLFLILFNCLLTKIDIAD